MTLNEPCSTSFSDVSVTSGHQQTTTATVGHSEGVQIFFLHRPSAPPGLACRAGARPGRRERTTWLVSFTAIRERQVTSRAVAASRWRVASPAVMPSWHLFCRRASGPAPHPSSRAAQAGRFSGSGCSAPLPLTSLGGRAACCQAPMLEASMLEASMCSSMPGAPRSDLWPGGSRRTIRRVGGYAPGMARKAAERMTDQELTDQDLEDLVRAGLDDEREGRVVHCADRRELGDLLDRLRSQPA